MRDADFVTTRSGARLFVRDWGDGAPVVLLPVERQLRDDLDGWIDANAEPFCPGASPRTIAWLAAMVQGASRQAIVAFQHEIAHADFRAEFARVDVPVTIIQGDLDVSAPPALCGERMAALRPDAEYLAWTGVATGRW